MVSSRRIWSNMWKRSDQIELTSLVVLYSVPSSSSYTNPRGDDLHFYLPQTANILVSKGLNSNPDLIVMVEENKLLYCFNHLIYLLCLPCVSLATSMIVLIVATCSSSPGFHYTTYLCAPSPLIINPLVMLSAGDKMLIAKKKNWSY